MLSAMQQAAASQTDHAYCRNNFLAQKPLRGTARHAQVVRRRFFMFQQDGTSAHQHLTPSLSFSERDARNVSSSIGACVRVREAHFEHEFWQFWAHLSRQLITLLNKPYFSLLYTNSVVRYFVANNTFQRYVTIENIWVSQGKAVTWVRLGGKYL